jgi:hypothetical protein
MIQEGPKRLEEMMTMRLSEKLHLSENQVPSVLEKVHQLAEDFDKSFESHRESMDARIDKLLRDIRPLLNPDQQKVLDGMTADDLTPRLPPRPPQPPDSRPHDGSPPPDGHMRNGPPPG